MPVVSVILPTCDRPGLLRTAIDSILAVDRKIVTLEILLIDDGEGDNTRAIASEYPIRYFRGSRRGPSAARNIGLDAATGDYITFLDDDDTWAPNNLKVQLSLLETNYEYGGTCSRFVLTDANGAVISEPYPETPLMLGSLKVAFLSYIPQVATLLVRRNVAKKVGLFDPSLQGGEDWDWALRVASETSLAFVKDVALYWRMHDSHRLDGAGNNRIEDVTWRRYHDVMKVARAHVLTHTGLTRLERQRLLLKHRGHYPQLFMRYASAHWQAGNIKRAKTCAVRAALASPLHFAKL